MLTRADLASFGETSREVGQLKESQAKPSQADVQAVQRTLTIFNCKHTACNGEN